MHSYITILYNHIGFSWKALEEWKEFLWLGVPGMVVVCSEWLAFEIGSFVSGSVDGMQLAAFTITLNLIALFFVVSSFITTFTKSPICLV